jgi:mRNA interferase RelE/StbE
MYTVKYSSSAKKDIEKLSVEVGKRIKNAIEEMTDDPYSHVKKLKTSSNSPIYSLRVGEYRVIMAIENSQLIILVLEIGNRSKIYRKF